MRRTVVVLTVLALLAGLISPAAATSQPGDHDERRRMDRYAADTWASFVAMTNETTGLPADNCRWSSSPLARRAGDGWRPA